MKTCKTCKHYTIGFNYLDDEFCNGCDRQIYSNYEPNENTKIINKKEKIIDETVEWFTHNWRNYIDTDSDGMIRFSGWQSDYKKAMEYERK